MLTKLLEGLREWAPGWAFINYSQNQTAKWALHRGEPLALLSSRWHTSCNFEGQEIATMKLPLSTLQLVMAVSTILVSWQPCNSGHWRAAAEKPNVSTNMLASINCQNSRKMVMPHFCLPDLTEEYLMHGPHFTWGNLTVKQPGKCIFLIFQKEVRKDAEG